MANKRPLITSTTGLTEITSADTLVTSGGHVDIGALGIGYGTGAGGAVTQITSRATGVTLSKITGAVTLFSKVTTAGLLESFTVTNTTVGANDLVVVFQKTGTGFYIVTASNVAAGSFKINIYTPTAVATAEAPVISFAVIKGAIA